jgi:hypothetical protein
MTTFTAYELKQRQYKREFAIEKLIKAYLDKDSEDQKWWFDKYQANGGKLTKAEILKGIRRA